MFDLNVTEEELQKNEGLVKKSVKFPELCLTRFVLYDIDSPNAAKEDARKYNTKLSIMNGLDVRLAAVKYWDETKEITVIDYSNPNEIKLPNGETGFKNILWFRLSDKWLQFQKFARPKDDAEAKFLFNVWLEKVTGIPSLVNKDLTQGGIMFNAWRKWYMKDVTKEDGKTTKQYQVDISPYNAKRKARLTDTEIDVEIINPTLLAGIINAITPPDDSPF